ncbi:MAG: beta-lactamase family protein [Acidobacteriota bacterium]|nr:beta-lactamase family protein [Acidobacteriota bacterium]
MKKLIFSALLLFLCRAAAAAPIDVKRIEAVADAAARKQLATGAVPGITIAVAQNGEIVFTRGYGKANVELNVAATPDTVYALTSVSKQFTAALIMRLVEAGKIALDDPISKYLPDFPLQGNVVTIRHLLTHTSGMKDYGWRHEKSPQWMRLDVTYPMMIELWGNQPFDAKPGEKHEYNNLGYYLLGEIIAKVAGVPYAQAIERDLLQPLGLRETVYCGLRRIVPNRAQGYEYDNGTLTNVRFVNVDVFGGAGGLCSDANDLIRWTNLLHSGKAVSPESLRLMTSPFVVASGEKAPYGYGLKLDVLEGHRKVFHGGTRPGGTYLTHYPDDGWTIAVLTNSATVGREKASEIEEAIARVVLGVEFKELPLDAKAIAMYEGTYTFELTGRTLDIRVYGEGNELHAQATGQRSMRLLHQGNHEFVSSADSDIRLTFAIENGRATGATLHQKGRHIPGKRK